MGVVLWIASGLIAFLFARLVPFGRRQAWLAEFLTTLFAAAALGVLATALDFGGWRELDWRAGLFSVFGSFAAAGALRALQSQA